MLFKVFELWSGLVKDERRKNLQGCVVDRSTAQAAAVGKGIAAVEDKRHVYLSDYE